MEKRRKKHILVIEDEKHIAEGLKLNLSFCGYDVSVAQDGVSGLQKWRENRPDLIILDIMLPGIDGLSVLRNIRLEDVRIPILILSAKGTPDDKIKGLSYGVDDYLSKPFNLEEFLLRVERLLARVDMYRSESNVSSLSHTYSFRRKPYRFCYISCRLQRWKDQPDRAGNQTAETFYCQSWETAFARQAFGNRMGLYRKNNHQNC